jgi:hypothetical protein
MVKHVDIGHLNVSYWASMEERKMAYSRKLLAVLAEIAFLEGDHEEYKQFTEISVNAKYIKYSFNIDVEAE